MTALDRFYKYVQKTETCWLWIAGQRKGYGRFWVEGKSVPAHNWIFQQEQGLLQPGEVACHRCDNPLCVRTSHLFRGTQLQNIQDAIAKGRFNRYRLLDVRVPTHGEHNGNHTLTGEEVLEIRRIYKPGHAPYQSATSLRSLAKKYGVSKYAIWSALKGLTWAHL